MSFIVLYHLLGSKVVDLDGFVLRAGSKAVTQLVKFDAVDYSAMSTVLLDLLLSLNVPHKNVFVIARSDIR